MPGGRLSSEQRVAVAGLPNITLEESEYKLEWMHDPWVDVAASGDWLLELANDSSPTSSPQLIRPWGLPWRAQQFFFLCGIHSYVLLGPLDSTTLQGGEDLVVAADADAVGEEAGASVTSSLVSSERWPARRR